MIYFSVPKGGILVCSDEGMGIELIDLSWKHRK